MPIVEVTIVPVGTGTTSLSRYVADMQNLLEQAREPIHYQLTPMSTIIEGELTDLLEVVRRLHESPFVQGADRVCTTIKIDDRRDRPSSMEQKMKSVADRLQSST
ncbi:MTH1187 family thiamine-binding protein [Paenibacillus mesophilus]|uniref:MTH1187 family thiamine-binding protein n=1 Tax=Paenibacillus mesophilus TaxID=2582849 RepID=UPI00110E743B|nr:MTH1187 family thiamine-binding protein [Paenibacillus mesophilus]TMV50974.1 MTH1187 family thiamine-binding protein [Paenibacillus mesophilus]